MEKSPNLYACIATSNKEEMMVSEIAAIVIAPPDRFRESLQILVTSIQQIETVYTADDVTSAISITNSYFPALVILVSNVSIGELPAELDRLRAEWQFSKKIVLVEDEKKSREAEANGADLVLVEGFPAAKLISAVEDLLTKFSSPNEHATGIKHDHSN